MTSAASPLLFCTACSKWAGNLNIALLNVIAGNTGSDICTHDFTPFGHVSAGVALILTGTQVVQESAEVTGVMAYMTTYMHVPVFI